MRLGAVAVAGGAVRRVRQPRVLEDALDERYGKLNAKPLQMTFHPVPTPPTIIAIALSKAIFAGAVQPTMGYAVCSGILIGWSSGRNIP